MDPAFKLEMDSNQEEAAIRVAPACLWELVEHLADRRVRVFYEYVQGQFRVRFPSLTEQEAERILEDFTARRRTAPPEQASCPPMAAEAYLG